MIQSFDSAGFSKELPNPMSDGFDDNETSETFEFATDPKKVLQTSVKTLCTITD